MQKAYLFLYPVMVVIGILTSILAIAHAYMPPEGYSIYVPRSVIGRALSAMSLTCAVIAIFTFANWYGTTRKTSSMTRWSLKPLPMRLVFAGVALMALGFIFLVVGREDRATAVTWAYACLWITVALYAIAFFIRGMISDETEAVE